jgi:ABC-type branched-subunit amino acid transport system substrate-binding protein
MRIGLRLLIPIVAFAICSCGTTQYNPKLPSGPESAANLFATAENLFYSNSYENALEVYQEFLDRYPSDSNADIALWRLATIYSNQKKYGLSQMAYQRLAADYPHSEFAADALIEIMMFLYNDGRLKEVIFQASKIIEKSDSKTHLSRTYEILGDTYMSLKSPKEAILFYQMADPSNKETLPPKFKDAANQLNEEDRLSLIGKLNDQFLTGYLLFERGLYQFQKENYKEALDIFSEFTTDFPHHQKRQEALELIQKINERLVFKRRLIGCLLPLTGPYAAFGNRALKGIQFALDQFNSQSNQPAFKIIFEDTHSDPETTIRAIRQFDKSRVSIIIGPIITSEYAAKEAQIRGIPIITLSQKPDIPELGDYVFRVFLTPQMQMDTLVPYVVNELGIKRFAVLYPEESYGNIFLNVFRERVLDHGASLVAIESYKPEQTDFAAQIKKILKMHTLSEEAVSISKKHLINREKRHQKFEVVLDFDAIFIPDSADKIALIAPQLAFYDIDNVLLMGTNLWHSDKLIHLAQNYVQEAILTDAFYAKDSKKNIKKFIMDFEKINGEIPGLIEALAYDTAMMNFYNLSNPEIQSRSDLKHALKNQPGFDGITGQTSFKENGDAVKRLYLLQVEENRFVQVN